MLGLGFGVLWVGEIVYEICLQLKSYREFSLFARIHRFIQCTYVPLSIGIKPNVVLGE